MCTCKFYKYGLMIGPHAARGTQIEYGCFTSYKQNTFNPPLRPFNTQILKFAFHLKIGRFIMLGEICMET